MCRQFLGAGGIDGDQQRLRVKAFQPPVTAAIQPHQPDFAQFAQAISPQQPVGDR